MSWDPLPEEAGRLPAPLANLRVDDLLERLHSSIEPCYHLDAQLLIQEYFELATQWYAKWPNLPLIVYKQALELCWSPEPVHQVVARFESFTPTWAMFMIWLLVSHMTLPGRQRSLMASVSKLLFEIFEEPAC